MKPLFVYFQDTLGRERLLNLHQIVDVLIANDGIVLRLTKGDDVHFTKDAAQQFSKLLLEHSIHLTGQPVTPQSK
jgi:hypothetical protein